VSKLTAYSALTTPAPTDMMLIVDVSDTSMAASGTTKKIALSDVLGAVSLTASGDSTGATDTAAIQSALNTGGLIILRGGTFWTNATLNMTVSGTTLMGAGAQNTILKSVTGNAANVMLQLGDGTNTIGDCNVYDILFDSATQKTANAAVDITKGFRTKIERCRFYHQYFCIHVHNSTCTWITDDEFRDTTGDAIAYDSDLGAGFDLYITNCIADNPVITNAGNGINWTGGENLVIHNCDFEHFVTGFMVNPGSGRQCRWGFLSAAEFDTCSDNTIHFTNGSGDIAGVTLTNCWAGTATNYGVLIDGSGAGGIMAGIKLLGCKILHNGLAGIRLINGAVNTTISDCDIISNSQTVSNTRSGIEVTATTQDFVIIGNQITNGWGQGSTQSNGINFDSGATTHFVIEGNDVRGNVNLGINNVGGVTGTDGRIHNNLGYNPVGALGPPGVPATTVAFTNPYNVSAMVYITAGTSTCAVAVGGSAMFTIPASGVGTVRVPPNQTITLTYTNAPTWHWTGD